MKNLTTEEKLENALARITKLEAELAAALRTNILTGLPNKKHLYEHIEGKIPKIQRSGFAGKMPKSSTFVFSTDLDNFKHINDTYGHEFGDKVLKYAANSYVNAMRESDLVFHASGDEFIIIAEVECKEGAERIKSKIQNSISELELSINNINVNIGVSVGYKQITMNDTVVSDLLTLADDEMQIDKDWRESQGKRYKRAS